MSGSCINRYYFRLLFWWAGIPKTQSFNLCPYLTVSVRNGPSVSFGSIIPCNVLHI